MNSLREIIEKISSTDSIIRRKVARRAYCTLCGKKDEGSGDGTLRFVNRELLYFCGCDKNE